MSPYETIKAKYEASEHVESWVWWMTYYAHFGYWFNEPDFFICGEYKEIDGKRCWYIFAMAGDMAKAWSVLPYHLPWMAFERIRGGKRELTIVPTDTMKRLTPRMDEPIFTD